MIICVDADYRPNEVVAAAVGIQDWPDAAPSLERVLRSRGPAVPYIPGQFYLREMPVIAELLSTIEVVDLVVVDGYVWLAKDRPGLGARLFDRLGGRYPVIGVAKRPFRGNDRAVALRRGGSARPLYVTAVGIELDAAVAGVVRMHGPHRMPTILKRVDRLASA